MHQILSRVVRLLPVAVLFGLLGVVHSAAAVDVGDAMLDFSLPASDGKTYTLSQFKGKQPVVIAFFPMAGTPG
ncbi:MAG: Alkyl hydroperoxide reductase/Thiol specific antioxidant/Mal allergen [Gammaproteobacteria bacterium]|nr:Alkyl hydroperoxide reductase/Thiol specific antioxidant/Mal allergen [Gammaproteobacteria bacterium]